MAVVVVAATGFRERVDVARRGRERELKLQGGGERERQREIEGWLSCASFLVTMSVNFCFVLPL